MNDRSSRSRFEWMSPWLEMCGCITPFALSWQKAGRLYDKLSWWNYTVKSAKRTKNRFISLFILFRRFNVSYRLFRMMFDVGYLLFFYAEVVETVFFFCKSKYIYKIYKESWGDDLKLLLETVVIQIFQRTQNRDQELTIAQFYWLLIVAKSFSLLQKCRTSLPNTKSLQILQPPGDASLLKGTKAVKLNICPVRTNEKKRLTAESEAKPVRISFFPQPSPDLPEAQCDWLLLLSYLLGLCLSVSQWATLLALFLQHKVQLCSWLLHAFVRHPDGHH